MFRFEALGRWIHRHRGRVLLVWLAVLIVGGLGASRLQGALIEGTAAIPGSPSEKMERTLEMDFANPYARNIVITLSASRFTVDHPAYKKWINEAIARISRVPRIQRVRSVLDAQGDRLRSPDGHQTAILAGINAKNLQDEQLVVPDMREALKELREGMLAVDPASLLAVTGRGPLAYDIDMHASRDGQTAETRALPLTLLILVVAFGALVAAGIPLLVAVAGTTITLGIVYLITLFLPLSNLLENIVTMIGLAVGIDYSLLMVNRFRTALVAHAGHVEDALADVVSKAGIAIVYSGLTVMIGLAALLLTPLMEFQGCGIGGVLVVIVSVLAALTLVPALLSYAGPRIDWPRWISGRLGGGRSEEGWKRLAEWVMNRPIRVLVLATGAVLLIAWPVMQMKVGFPNSKWFPRSMESRTGIEILDKIGNSNTIFPTFVVVRANDGKPILAGSHLPALISFASRLEADERVGEVLSPVSLRDDLGLFQYLTLYRNLDKALAKYPDIGEIFLSRDRTAALFQVVAGPDALLSESQDLAREITRKGLAGPFTLEVGGEPQYYNDFNERMGRSYPLVFAFVIGVTLIVLFAAFRSYLLPLKAVAMNILSVGAGYGAIVAIFQFGWGYKLLGLEEPLGIIPISIPMMVFCITFGLSMDYEVFLLSRIKEIYDKTGDNRQATAEGLASTGGVITSAAMIMVVVFGAFAGAEIVLVKMIGVGLAVSVFVDATIIRIFLVPALMRLAGQWNWYPGEKRALRTYSP